MPLWRIRRPVAGQAATAAGVHGLSPARPVRGGRARARVRRSGQSGARDRPCCVSSPADPPAPRHATTGLPGCYTGAVRSSQLIEIPAVDRLVAELARQPEVVRVWLFGSRARGDHGAQSDIDLAVEAPTASRRTWLELCRLVEEAATLLRIDLVRVEEAPPTLAQQIRREGRVLYER